MRPHLPAGERKKQIDLGIQEKYIDAVGGYYAAKEIGEQAIIKKAKQLMPKPSKLKSKK